MEDENPIHTLGDYSKPSHEGYRNTIELPVGNNVVPLRSDTIWLVQNGCSFYGLRSEDLNQHLKDFLKLMNSFDLDGENRERMRLYPFFYDHVSFHLKCEINRAADGKLCNKNADESWEIIENLALYDHEGWDVTKDFIKPVKAISTPQSTSKTPDRRLLELEDQINFLLKRSRPTPRPSSTHIPQAYAKAVYSNPRPQNQNEPLKQNPFTFHERTGPNPQPQAFGITFEARVRDYMAAHTERMERFKNAIFKQHEEINDRMTKMFGLLKELTTSRTLEKVLIREEAKFPVTKNVNSISLTRGEEEKSDNIDVETVNDIEKPTRTETGMQVNEAKKKSEAGKEEMTEVPSSQPVEYYLKHSINKKLIEGLVDNRRFNDSLSGARVKKIKGKTYNLSPRGPVYEAILTKKITRKEDIGGNFKIPCNIGGLKHMNTLVDQGSNVNVMPLSTYMKLTDERPTKTDVRLSLASNSYIYLLGITEDVLVEVDEHVYPMDFVILDIKEDKKRPFILGTPFLTTFKA
ncbi:MAK10-like protein [Tanacetum coccineum]|uniref:MAK10-like protein n=1 Tax=Tanacetum coccineum TaxID=301880 RepID=A0ABQ5CD74_9ASTR